MNIHGKNIIAGARSAQGSQRFQAVDPTNQQALPGQFVRATNTEIDRALEAARQAFVAYRQTTPAQRAQFLQTIADQILELGPTLLERTAAETALPLARLEGERGRTVGQLRKFAELLLEGSWVQARIDHAQPDRQPLPRPDVRSMQLPIGPVAVFGASNFPLAFSVAGGDTASALAAGCPVIVKAHPAHPGASELVAGAIAAAAEQCGMPAGVFSMVHGDQEESRYLVQHPALKAVGFTGSLRAGRALFDLAAARPEPIPVFAEMGSVNPIFILPDFLENHGASLAAGLCGSISLGVGQFCTNPGLVIACQGKGLSDLFENLGQAFRQQAPGFMLHAGIHQAFIEGLKNRKKQPGVATLAESAAPPGPGQAEAAVLQVSGGDFLKNPGLQEELFGPSSLVVAAENTAQMESIIGHLQGQLTCTVYGTETDLQNFPQLIDQLAQKAGRLLFGGFPTGVEVCDAMVHSGPYPATSDARSTSVGTAAIYRFVRPVAFQNFPDHLLPEALQDANPAGIFRMVDGQWGRR